MAFTMQKNLTNLEYKNLLSACKEYQKSNSDAVSVTIEGILDPKRIQNPQN